MTEQYVALNPGPHRTHGFKRAGDLAHFCKSPLFPIYLGELDQAQSVFPLAFVQGPEGWTLVALQALTLNDNLFINEQGAYLPGIYLPQALRAYPFALLERTAEDKVEYFLGFDRQSNLYREMPDPAQGEERFFDDEGQPEKFMQQLTAFMAQRLQQQRMTQRAVGQLAQHQLLQPWAMPEQRPESAEPPLTGLYCLNGAAFQALSGDVLKALQMTGALQIAYAQLHAMTHLTVLQALAQRRQQRTAKMKATPASEATASPLNSLGETFKFNF